MIKQCDHTSVGMLVRRDDKILLIERKRAPFGFALPAGHVDEDATFEIAARRELQEEVGLIANELTLLIEGRKENPCRREGGAWHYWKIYQTTTQGEMRASEAEVKQMRLVSHDELCELALRTERYINKEIQEDEWMRSPGIEPVWYGWLKELRVL